MALGRVSTAALLSDVRRVARLLGHSPSSVEYARHGRYNEKTLRARFGGSWAEIVEGAGLRYVRRYSYRVLTTAELRADVLRVARLLEHPPNHGQYKTLGRFSPETIKHRAGVREWARALAAIVGFDTEEVKQHCARGGPYRTTAQWLARVRALANSLGRAPSSREAKAHGISTSTLYERVGGMWSGILKAAGVDAREMRGRLRTRATPTEALLDDVVRLARRLGRAPTRREYAADGRYDSTTVGSRLGGWDRVKETVRERLAADRHLVVGDPPAARHRSWR